MLTNQALNPVSFGNEWKAITRNTCKVSHCLKVVPCDTYVAQSLSQGQLFVIPWTTDQAPLSMGFSRPEYWSGLPFPSLGDLPYPGIEPGSSALQGDSLPSEPWGKLFAKGFGWVKPVKARFHPGRGHWPRCRCQGDQRCPLAQDFPGFSAESPHVGLPSLPSTSGLLVTVKVT